MDTELKANAQQESLQNAVNSTKLERLTIHKYLQSDKRKTTPLFVLALNNCSISPVLNYDKMNHFILGFSKALKINQNS